MDDETREALKVVGKALRRQDIDLEDVVEATTGKRVKSPRGKKGKKKKKKRNQEERDRGQDVEVTEEDDAALKKFLKKRKKAEAVVEIQTTPSERAKLHELEKISKYWTEIKRVFIRADRFLSMNNSDIVEELQPIGDGDTEQIRVYVQFDDGTVIPRNAAEAENGRKNVFQAVASVLQSESMKLHGDLDYVQIVQYKTSPPSAGGRGGCTGPPRTVMDLKKKDSCILLQNTDDLCFDRSLAILEKREWAKENNQWKQLRNPSGKYAIQKRFALSAVSYTHPPSPRDS